MLWRISEREVPAMTTSAAKPHRYPKKLYKTELLRLQGELVQMQEWIQASGARLVVIFEGRDAAGKGGAVQRVVENLNPASRASSSCPGRPSASAHSGTSNATSRTCRPRGDRAAGPVLVQPRRRRARD